MEHHRLGHSISSPGLYTAIPNAAHLAPGPYQSYHSASARTSMTKVDLEPIDMDAVVPSLQGNDSGETPPTNDDGVLASSSSVPSPPPPSPPPIPQMPQTWLTFLLVSGDRRMMNFEPETTVGRVKELVWSAWSSDWQERPPAPTYLRILYLGKVLQDDDTLTKIGFPSFPLPSTDADQPPPSPSSPSHALNTPQTPATLAPTSTIVHLSIRSHLTSANTDGEKPKKKKSLRRRGETEASESTGAGAVDEAEDDGVPPRQDGTLIDVERGELPPDSDQSSFHKTSGGKYTKRIKYYIPGIAWIPNYSISYLGGDVLAGLTVASMLIPQSVSYATSLAQMSPLSGLFSASVPGLVYAFLGTCRQLNVAPEAALSLLVGQAVADILSDHPNAHSEEGEAIRIAVGTIITMQVGLFAFLLGFFRLGFIDVVLSRALLRGFISAIAVVILTEQLVPMFGLSELMRQYHPESTFDKALFLIEHVFPSANVRTTIVSFSALAVLVALRAIKAVFQKYWWIYRVPEVLVVVILSTFLCSEFRWDEEGVAILGAVPITSMGSFVQVPFQAANLKYLRRTTSTSILIAVVGFLDSIVAAKQNASRFGYTISPNRELVALGAANLTASFVPGTLPAWGSITRSKINGDVGGRTQMASIVCCLVVLLATFFLLPWLYFLPKCVLSAIICLVVFSLLREAPHEVRYYVKMRAWVDLGLMSMTFFAAIIWNIEVGILLSVVASLLLVVHRSSKTRMTILGRIPGTDRWKPISDNPEAEEDVPGVLIVRIRENLDFANTAQLKERLRRLELYGLGKSHPSEEPRRQQATILVFHMADVETCDASAVEMFHELCSEYKASPRNLFRSTSHDVSQNRHVRIFITHLQPRPLAMFSKVGIFDLLDDDALQVNVADAMSRIEAGGHSRFVTTVA
ncbi:unnamed protein product [Mycena citricolor]|uniref:STAS domain-containing protein n=1 Tax=Mycena citricolor TaxID=2018698 RepID=A0AAD2HJ87_9AGAR|nr:unnamed protein product [Mycena citricolor]